MRALILTLIALVLWTGAASATPEEQEESTLGAKAPQAKASFLSTIDFSLEYSARTNFNENVSPHTYDQALEFSVARQFWEKYTFFASAGIEYETVGMDVYRARSTDQYYTPRDWTVGATTDYALGDRNHLTLFLTQDFLTSVDSRYFGYRSVTGAKGSLTTRLTKWLSLRQSLEGAYVMNRNRFAPVGSPDGSVQMGDILPDAIVEYSIGPVFTVFKNLRLGALLAVRGTHYLDNTNLYGFGNSYSAVYSIKNWSVWVRYLNRGYAERGETNLWFADEYRRLASAGLTFDF